MNMMERIRQWIFTEKVMRNGIYAPIIITTKGVVIDGHHRILAAKRLGIKIPAIVIDIEIVYLDADTVYTKRFEQ